MKEGCRKSTGQRRLHDLEYGQNSRTKQRGLTAWRLYPASGAKSDDDLLMTSATRTLRKIKFQEWFWNIDFNTYFTNTLFRGIKISKTRLATLYALQIVWQKAGKTLPVFFFVDEHNNTNMEPQAKKQRVWKVLKVIPEEKQLLVQEPKDADNIRKALCKLFIQWFWQLNLCFNTYRGDCFGSLRL